MDDAHYMRKALALAERGRGHTSPNPMVGAVVVDDRGVIVGRGAHRRAGEAHAEVLALEDAGARAKGGTLYCTLEPCTHSGRTGPCAPVVVAAGIRRAVVAIEDPNPLVNGGGVRWLRQAGIDTSIGVEAEAAARQNAVFLTNMRARRPYVIVKVALSVDGAVGLPGTRTYLTGASANRQIHRQRAEVDALAVGSGTVLTDDPLLTPRGAYRDRPLTRVIFDRRLRTPPTARVLSTAGVGPVIIVTGEGAVRSNPGSRRALEAAGARVLPLADPGLAPALSRLGDEGVTSLVLEGGAALHRAALDTGVADEIDVYITPRRLGPEGIQWLPPHRLTWAVVRERQATWFGQDLLVEGLV